MEKPIKWRWLVVVTLAAWVFMVVCFLAGTIPWPEFTLVHTLLLPTVMLAAMLPFAVKAVAASPQRKIIVALWSGVMIPTTYLFIRGATGFGGHCDLAFTLAGGLIFLILAASWVAEQKKSSAQTVKAGLTI
ncbi:MAG: hypothetical protein AAB677_03155 [Patescibacteria group bacterium]